ncbi:MAG: hypothetical protein ACKO7O_06480 [Bacteroidota bacterium]
MSVISERISFIDDATKTTIVILPKKQPWVIALMGAWLGMWVSIGLITWWALLTMKLTQQERIILWVFLSFWVYYAIRVGRSFLWLVWGKELIKIDEIGLHIKRSIRTYGKSVPYYFENIKDLAYDFPEERSFQTVWESSPWVNGGERFFFEYYGKMIKFGKKLTKKEAQLLTQVMEKRMRKYSKK